MCTRLFLDTGARTHTLVLLLYYSKIEKIIKRTKDEKRTLHYCLKYTHFLIKALLMSIPGPTVQPIFSEN